MHSADDGCDPDYCPIHGKAATEILTDEPDTPALIDPRKIVGVGEIASLFMVSKSTASNWYIRRDRNGHPEAIAYLSCGTLFDIDEVVKWYVDYKPLKGGRPGSAPRSIDGRYLPAC